jgi:hypothetical protein
MSFSVSFFARDVNSARTKLHDASAPAGVKALIELALAGIPLQSHGGSGAGSAGIASQARTSDAAKEAGTGSNSPSPRSPRLCGILVETHGHIDEHGARSNLGTFRVEPYYD